MASLNSVFKGSTTSGVVSSCESVFRSRNGDQPSSQRLWDFLVRTKTTRLNWLQMSWLCNDGKPSRSPSRQTLAPLETIKSPELIQNAFVVVPLCKWKLEPALCRLGKRFHHRHNAFPEFGKMLHDVSLTFFAVEKWNFGSFLSLSHFDTHASMSVSIPYQSAFDCQED